MDVYLGIGSNIGDRELFIKKALEALDRKEGIRVMRVSSFYETEPVGGPPQGMHINAAIAIETDLEPIDLLITLKEIEKELGREKTVVKNRPRQIDLDILLYGDQKLDEGGLTIPHPGLHERQFVLRPLNEIASMVIHPLFKKTVKELYEDLSEDKRCQRVRKKR
ncbi:MAG: 2-amino-4-hydroxy-6-hydroxymethyldihydropteridine diphosphokinase [Candidatus Omnitrophica bacterium]|nr:2-amino-4-hydroxy-6-hydroxymethyldihydropteridine diphosphokinase [Candidatus Omnitrophota bacterium]